MHAGQAEPREQPAARLKGLLHLPLDYEHECATFGYRGRPGVLQRCGYPHDYRLDGRKWGEEAEAETVNYRLLQPSLQGSPLHWYHCQTE